MTVADVTEVEIDWFQLAIRFIRPSVVQQRYSIDERFARNKMRSIRTRLKGLGWEFPREMVGNYEINLPPVAPEGVTAEEWLATNPDYLKIPYFGTLTLEQQAHREKVEQETGRPVLTWREMAILGWSLDRAVAHRGTSTHDTARTKMRQARQKLREEDWQFQGDVKVLPPEIDRCEVYAREKADAQLKSNWLTRLNLY